MSCESAVCRTCLATDIKMLDLKNTKLQDIFEKLTGNKLGTLRGWICYICCSQLQKCQRFFNMALKADHVLRQLQTKGIQLIPDSVTALRPTHSFLTTPVEYMALPDVDGVVSVKIEPMDFKEEVLEGIEVVKIEDTTADLMTMCEESYIADDQKIYSQTWTQQIEINKKHFETNAKNVPCKDCGKLFISIEDLKSHLDTHKYNCEFCNYKCTDSLVFQRHLRKHTKPFHCKLCNKSFSELSSLRKHKTTHSSKKPYQCDHCSKVFSHKTYLIAHIRTHSPEKPFKCEICFKQFGQTGHLISHKLTHYPKMKQTHKTHKCLVCGKGFAARNGLNRHMKTHTGQRPYSCEFCFKTFAALDTLKSHVRCHTGEKPFPCNICGRSFTTRGNTAKHMKTHHVDELLTEMKQ